MSAPRHTVSPPATDPPGPTRQRGRFGGRPRQPRSPLASLLELVVIVAIALGLALGIQALIVKPYRIPSGSMEPTLTIGQHVLVNRVAMNFSDPTVGGIYVFHPPAAAEQQTCGPSPHQIDGRAACSEPVPRESGETYIKRIVAGPGDQIYISEGHVYRRAAGHSSFLREADGYIRPCGSSPECNLRTAITIPGGHWFMMGDNRGDSDDSRFWGPVPTGWIIGQAIATYWPPSRVGVF